MTTAPKRPVSRVLEMSSPIMARTQQLYRERLPREWCPSRSNEAIWSDCARQAREEIVGDR